MDIILEIFDTFLFDRMYTTILPASPSSAWAQAAKNAVSSTFSSMREGATLTPQHKYIYTPASPLIRLEPTIWTFGSSWQRDNMYRQFTSLFLITWYVTLSASLLLY